VLLSVPVSVLKSGSIEFTPDLPEYKTISLGCGQVEKVGIIIYEIRRIGAVQCSRKYHDCNFCCLKFENFGFMYIKVAGVKIWL